MAKRWGWYPVSTTGMFVTFLYALVPPYIVYAQTTNTFPEELRLPLIAAMGFVVLLMLICRRRKLKIFHQRSS